MRKSLILGLIIGIFIGILTIQWGYKIYDELYIFGKARSAQLWLLGYALKEEPEFIERARKFYFNPEMGLDCRHNFVICEYCGKRYDD